MARHHRRLRCWLTAFGGSLACWVASAADPLPQQVEHPFRNLAAWLREVSPDLRSADPKTISRGITVLSNSQSYVKSFDGMAYELKGKLKEGTSTSDIETLREQAQLYESASSAKKAGKLVKLLIEVEKALNSAEAAEIAAQFDPAVTASYMKDAGLRFLPTPPPPPPPPPPPRENSTDDKNNTTSTESGGETDIGISKSTGNGAPKGVKGTTNGTKLPRRTASSKKETDTGKRRSRSSKTSPRKGSRNGRKSHREEVGDDDDSAGAQALVRLEGEGDDEVGRDNGAAGEPLEEFIVEVAGCEVQCLLMVDEREKRLVVAVGDALSGEALMGSLFEEPATLQLASHGLMRETAYVNRAAFQCACDILEWAGPFIEASLATGPFEGYPVHCAGHSFGGAVAACLAGLLDGAIDVEADGKRRNGENSASRPVEDENRGPSARRRTSGQGRDRRKPGRGARGEPISDPDSDGGSEGDGGEDALRVDGAAPWVGVCRDRVTCVTLGCPPCLSRNLRLPFVTSFVLGDDMVPRTSHESLRRLKRRLLQVMPKGKGLLSQGMAFSTSLFTDVAGVAMQGVRQATTLGEDDARLTVPGRVWFAKPRRLKNGATLARVMQGNLREDMLWQLRDIMLTKSMLSHHRLDKYIKILDRV